MLASMGLNRGFGAAPSPELRALRNSSAARSRSIPGQRPRGPDPAVPEPPEPPEPP